MEKWIPQTEHMFLGELQVILFSVIRHRLEMLIQYLIKSSTVGVAQAMILLNIQLKIILIK